MGGRKVENVLNENRRSRMDCFTHRSKGILKKLYQLAYVSGCGVHLVMEAEDGNVYEFHRRMNPSLQRELAEALLLLQAANNNDMDAGGTIFAAAATSRRNGTCSATTSTASLLRASNKRFFFNGRDILDTGLQVSPAHRAAILDPNAACPCFDCLHGFSSRRFDVLFPFAPPPPPPSVPPPPPAPIHNAPSVVPVPSTPAPLVSTATTTTSSSLLLPYPAPPAPLPFHDHHHNYVNANAAFHNNNASATPAPTSQTTTHPPPPHHPPLPLFQFLPPQPPQQVQSNTINGTPISSIITAAAAEEEEEEQEQEVAAAGSISRYSTATAPAHPASYASSISLPPAAGFISTADFNDYQQLQGANHQHHPLPLHPPPTFTSTLNHPQQQQQQQQSISWPNNNNYSSSLLNTTNSYASNAFGFDLAVDGTAYYGGDRYNSYPQMNSNWNPNNNNIINDAYCNSSAPARLPEVGNIDRQQTYASAHSNMINYNISSNGDNNTNYNDFNGNCVSDSAAAELHAQFTSFDVTLSEFLEKMMDEQQQQLQHSLF